MNMLFWLTLFLWNFIGFVFLQTESEEEDRRDYFYLSQIKPIKSLTVFSP